MRSIKRTHPTSDETPPWAGISFIQPVDSDALHELLKNQYPQCTSLRQRKHMAAIEFLRRELESMQNEPVGTMAATSPGDQTHILLQMSRPGFDEMSERKHQRSISPSQSQSSSHRSPAILDDHVQQSPVLPKTVGGHQHVFSIVNGLATPPRKKRRMTPAERSAYKTTRKMGACEKCKRLKGKCTHVIETYMSNVKPIREDDVALQRPDASLSIIMAARSANDPARAREDTQDLTTSATAPGSPQWAQETQETRQGSHSEISGYVPSLVTGLYPGPPQNSQENQWNYQSSFAEPQPLRDNYNGYMDSLNQSGGSPAFPYPPGFYEQPWSQSTDYMSEANLG